MMTRVTSSPSPSGAPLEFNWPHAQSVRSIEYTCGHCQRLVASNLGFDAHVKGQTGRIKEDFPKIRICPNCVSPTIFQGGKQIPGIPPGNAVMHVPDSVNALYEEARRCAAANAATGAVLACRKLLMNIAVTQGATEGQSFISYVDYLANKGFVPPNGKDWVDHIRKKGNEANHEIPDMMATDAAELISFCEMLLKFIYEFPSKIPRPQVP